MSEEWSDRGRVAEYLAREIPHRQIAEEILLQALPEQVARFVDLGTGDGRLLCLLRGRYPGAEAIGLDSSPPMLDRARERFEGDPLVDLRQRNTGIYDAKLGVLDGAGWSDTDDLCEYVSELARATDEDNEYKRVEREHRALEELGEALGSSKRSSRCSLAIRPQPKAPASETRPKSRGACPRRRPPPNRGESS